MTLQLTGAISIDDLRVELGHVGALGLDDPESRGLADVLAGQISLSDFYGKSDTIFYTISASTNDFNLASALGNPVSPVNVDVTINAGVIVGTTHDTTGFYPFSTDGLPAGSTFIIRNNGTIQARGGRGESIVTANNSGGVTVVPSTQGTYAMRLTGDTVLYNNGTIYGGGSGGTGRAVGPGGAGAQATEYAQGGGGAPYGIKQNPATNTQTTAQGSFVNFQQATASLLSGGTHGSIHIGWDASDPANPAWGSQTITGNSGRNSADGKAILVFGNVLTIAVNGTILGAIT